MPDNKVDQEVRQALRFGTQTVLPLHSCRTVSLVRPVRPATWVFKCTQLALVAGTADSFRARNMGHVRCHLMRGTKGVKCHLQHAQ